MQTRIPGLRMGSAALLIGTLLAGGVLVGGCGEDPTDPGQGVQVLTIADVEVPENASEVQFVLSLPQAATRTVTVTVTTEAGTAGSPADFLSVNTAVTLPAGTSEVNVPVTIINDGTAEGDEWFLLNVDSVSGAEAPAQAARCTIVDNDFPLLSVVDEVAFEAGGVAVFTVFLSTPSGAEVVVQADTQNLTAVEGDDFIGWHDSLVIPAGRTAATLTVALIDDAESENHETFALLLSAAQNAGFIDASAVGTIVDDDGP